MARLTKRTVDAIKPEPGRDVLVWDDELRGFGVRCRPGGTKTYILKYRTAGGRQRWLTIGQHGPLTPEQARARALRQKAAVGDGDDPAAERQQKRRENTIAAVADRYLAEHVAAHNKPSTAAEVKRVVERRIKPKLGPIKIGDLARADVKAWHQAMSATPYEGNRALAYLSKLLTLAATDWELRAGNPCTGIKRFPEHKRERYFGDAELAQIGAALSAAEADGAVTAGFGLLVRLLATTGMRLGEALGLQWADIDLPERTITLRDAKAGGRTVHLGAAAAMLIEAAKGAANPDDDHYLVHGRDPAKPMTAPSAHHAWDRVRARAGVDGRMHDLRHTAGTFAAMSGANAFAVRDLLGHRTLAMTGRYVERAADMVRATADAVSSRVAAALNASATKPAEVIDLPRQRKR